MSLTSRSHQLAPCEEDRFSNLPSSVIGYVLSFLPTKDAVATSVLSTTWRDFWTLITCLDFDDDLLLRSVNKNRTELLKAEFVDFVSRVLLVGRFPWIEAFRLSCYHSDNPHNVSEWLESVLKSNVQELDVDVWFKDTDYLVLPRCPFTSRTLVKLKLRRHIYMNVPGSVYFPCLKLVKLDWVDFSDADSITRFLSGCPMLDSLYLNKCIGKNIEDVKISLPTLRSLTLAFLLIKEEDFDEGMVDVPHCYVFENEIPNLTSAAINIPSQWIWGLEQIPFKYVHHAAANDLLKGISKVRKLYFFTQGTDDEEDDMLELDASRSSVPKCLLLHLRTVEIVDFQGSNKEVKLVEYLLSNAEVLEKLTVCSDFVGKSRKGCELFLTLPRASMACQIEIL